MSTEIQNQQGTLDFSGGPSFLRMIKDYLMRLTGFEFNTRYRRDSWSYSKIRQKKDKYNVFWIIYQHLYHSCKKWSLFNSAVAASQQSSLTANLQSDTTSFLLNHVHGSVTVGCYGENKLEKEPSERKVVLGSRGKASWFFFGDNFCVLS